MDQHAIGQSCSCSGFSCSVFGLRGRMALMERDIFHMMMMSNRSVYLRTVCCYTLSVLWSAVVKFYFRPYP